MSTEPSSQYARMSNSIDEIEHRVKRLQRTITRLWLLVGALSAALVFSWVR